MLTDELLYKIWTSQSTYTDIPKAQLRYLAIAIEAEVMQAQEPGARANDAAKMRFFRDMISSERRKVFEVFGVESAVLNEVRSLSDEMRLFKHLFAAPQQPAPSPASDQTIRYATDLAIYLAKKFYPDVTQWRPLDDLVGVLTQIDNMVAGVAVERDVLRAEVERLTNERWCPTVCPITGRPFFMWIEHYESGRMVPTYGGPFDSYTIPIKGDDGEFVCERYDHDEGGWLVDEVVGLGLRLCNDQHEDYEFGTLEARDATIAQQAERIAEQAALIEKCEKAISIAAKSRIAVLRNGDPSHEGYQYRTDDEVAKIDGYTASLIEALSAISAHKS